MSLEDRDWFREQKLPDEAVGTEDRYLPGGLDVFFWIVLLVIVELILG